MVTAELNRISLTHEKALEVAVEKLQQGDGDSLAIIDDSEDRNKVLRAALAKRKNVQAISGLELSGWLLKDTNLSPLLLNIDKSSDVRRVASNTVLLAKIYLGLLRGSQLDNPFAVAKACRDTLIECRYYGSIPLDPNSGELTPQQQPYAEEINLMCSLWLECCQEQQKEISIKLDAMAGNFSGPVVRIRWQPQESLMLSDFLAKAAQFQPVSEIIIEPNVIATEINELWQQGRYVESSHFRSLLACAGNSLEQAAQASFSQLCTWLSENQDKRIGIVVFDRNLARRLNSLCSANGIYMVDRTGWQATSMLVGDMLLALASNETNRTNRLRLHKLLAYRSRHRDISWMHLTRQIMQDKDSQLDELADYCGILSTDNQSLTLAQWFAKLAQLATQEPLQEFLADDFAAIRLKKLLAQLANQFGAYPEQDNYKVGIVELRLLLLDTLSNINLIANEVNSNIQMISPRRYSSDHFDTLLCLGAHADNLPTSNSGNIFGDEVRSALGLPTQDEIATELRLSVASLLSEHDEVSVIWHGDTSISPYIELLQPRIIAPPQAFWETKTVKPKTIGNHQVSVHFLPKTIYVSDLDTLMDCPYRFYAKRFLYLRKDVRQAGYHAAEFGTFVHSVIDKFNKNLKHGVEIIELLHQVMNEYVDSHSGNPRYGIYRLMLTPYLEEFKNLIVKFLDAEGTIEESEKKFEESYEISLGKFTLTGICDRVDSYVDNSRGIIDIKTGDSSSNSSKLKNSISTGEKPQLAFYAQQFQADEKNVAIWKLGKEQEKRKVVSIYPFCKDKNENPMFTPVQIHTHILDVLEGLKNTPLPANGDEKNTCGNCDFDGLCRKSLWHQAS